MPIIAAPLSRWAPTSRRVAMIVAIAITAAFAVLSSPRFGQIFTQSDIGWYLRLASGQTHDVMQPFASRQLGPAVVRLLAWILHWPIERTYLLQGILSFAVVLATIYTFLLQSSAPRWMLAAIAFIPFWPQLWAGLVLPDLWYAALLCLFLLLLARNHLLAAACMLFPLMLSRESTSLTLVCFLLAAWKPLRWPGRLLALAATAAGQFVVGRLTAHNPGNMEHLPQSIYMLAKVPWNLLRNVLGINPWSNSFQRCTVPVWTHPFHYGDITSIGICGFSVEQPLTCLAAATTTFGLLPLLAAFLWQRTRRTAATSPQPRSVLLRFCLIYGAISFLLAPLLGVWAWRLFGYAWPLALVAVPLLFNQLDPLQTAALTGKRALAGLGFLALHLAASACNMLSIDFWVAYAGAALYLAGFVLLRLWFGPPNHPSSTPSTDVPS
jgi:hypothetical protein